MILYKIGINCIEPSIHNLGNIWLRNVNMESIAISVWRSTMTYRSPLLENSDLRNVNIFSNTSLLPLGEYFFDSKAMVLLSPAILKLWVEIHRLSFTTNKHYTHGNSTWWVTWVGISLPLVIFTKKSCAVKMTLTLQWCDTLINNSRISAEFITWTAISSITT